MNTYIVTRKSDGAEVYRYQAAEPIEWNGWEFATHNHALAPDPDAINVFTPPTFWDEVSFLRRFTDAERLAIRERALIDVMLQDFIELVRAAGGAKSDDPDLPRAMAYLVALQILTPARAIEIMGAA